LIRLASPFHQVGRPLDCAAVCHKRISLRGMSVVRYPGPREHGMSVRSGYRDVAADFARCVTSRTTNPMENLNGSIAIFTRNVKRWRD
jgi:hypothetical protein